MFNLHAFSRHPPNASAYLSPVRMTRGGPEVLHVLKAVRRLTDEGAEDARAVSELGSLARPGTLLQCAPFFERAPRLQGWLLMAAGDQPLIEKRLFRSDLEGAIQRLPPAQAYRLLASRVPALADLERDAASVSTMRGGGLAARLLRFSSRDQDTRRLADLLVLRRKAQALVGPKAGQVDPLLSSAEALTVVLHHLTGLIGLEPFRDDHL